MTIAAFIAICFTAASQEREKFDRGLGKANSLFVPKGTMTAGSSIAYHHYSAGNGDIGYELMSLLTGLEGSFSSVKVSPAAFWFIADNTAVGARFTYSYTGLDMDSASVSLGSDNSFDLSNRYFENRSYTGYFALRNYIPLFGSRIFAMFNELRVGGTRSQGKSYQMDGDEKDGTFSNGYSFNIGVCPGMTAFVTDNLSFEIALTVLECNYSYTKQIKNQVYTSSMSHFGTSFKPDMLSLSFAIMYYFRLGGK